MKTRRTQRPTQSRRGTIEEQRPLRSFSSCFPFVSFASLCSVPFPFRVFALSPFRGLKQPENDAPPSRHIQWLLPGGAGGGAAGGVEATHHALEAVRLATEGD